MTNLKRLKKRIAECGYGMYEFSKLLNLSYPAFCKRMSGEVEFKTSEICEISRLLRLSKRDVGEYFFADCVSKTETEIKC